MLLVGFCIPVNFFNLLQIELFKWFYGNISYLCFNTFVPLVSRFSSMATTCFSTAIPSSK